MQKLFTLLCLLLFSAALFSQAVSTSKGSGTFVLFDNDVHCAVDGYAAVADYKDSLLRAGKDVVVVSCGDFVSGSSFGSYSKGEYPARILNVAGYDYVSLGNHEFDYGLSQLYRIDSIIKPKVICCNYRSLPDYMPVFNSWAIYQSVINGQKIAFIGVATPSSMASSSPSYFKSSDNGDFLYTFGKDSLYAWVQRAVDSVRSLGADYVVMLSHLGNSDDPPTSIDLISNIYGVDVVLDGHSHNVISGVNVADIKGDSVLLCSTGSSFQHVGMVEFASSSHLVSIKLLSAEKTNKSMASKLVSDTIEALRRSIDELMRRTIGYSKINLRCDNDEGHRLVRMQEMPLGDFCADAFRVVLHADIGWVNGGGIRSSISVGEMKYNDIISVFPFDNKVAVVELTGQNILDALEMACRLAPFPYGGFPQLSGLRIVVDTAVISPVSVGKEGVLLLPDSMCNAPRRICHVEVWDTIAKQYRLLNPSAHYRLSSTTYILCNYGDGIPFPYLKILEMKSSSDAQILEEYITKYLKGVITTPYTQAQQRITYR